MTKLMIEVLTNGVGQVLNRVSHSYITMETFLGHLVFYLVGTEGQPKKLIYQQRVSLKNSRHFLRLLPVSGLSVQSWRRSRGDFFGWRGDSCQRLIKITKGDIVEF